MVLFCSRLDMTYLVANKDVCRSYPYSERIRCSRDDNSKLSMAPGNAEWTISMISPGCKVSGNASTDVDSARCSLPVRGFAGDVVADAAATSDAANLAGDDAVAPTSSTASVLAIDRILCFSHGFWFEQPHVECARNDDDRPWLGRILWKGCRGAITNGDARASSDVAVENARVVAQHITCDELAVAPANERHKAPCADRLACAIVSIVAVMVVQ
mmetsp:Transcript_8195/g.22245  ORF Transcript_8195/g.22245 Transcript_8195/m.22245 type:complete len:215 (+) Transcript_8195:1065-1709(+)